MASALDTTIKRWLRGLLGVHNSSTDDVEGMVKRAFKHKIVKSLSNDGSASTNIAATYFYDAANNVDVTAVSVFCEAAETLSSTDYATFNLLKANGGGGSATVVATANTSATNMAIGVPFDLTLNTTAASTYLNTGEVLAYQVTKAGSTGLAIGTVDLCVELEER